jgi:hypothetical protein
MYRPASIASPKSRPRGKVLIRRLVVIAFFVEVGLLLMVLPWSVFWEQNYFAHAWPVVEPIFLNNFVRGGISGLGLVNLVAGLSELMSIFVSREGNDTRLPESDADPDAYAKRPDARVEP